MSCPPPKVDWAPTSMSSIVFIITVIIIVMMRTLTSLGPMTDRLLLNLLAASLITLMRSSSSCCSWAAAFQHRQQLTTDESHLAASSSQYPANMILSIHLLDVWLIWLSHAGPSLWRHYRIDTHDLHINTTTGFKGISLWMLSSF